ncbi:hypothetical protein [Noviherbaspirillum humi]|uniref:hypothetical protein n=1 Tax=Noviherbaspirillum humi TaxID=1688639 RepID=UPI001160134B|nr:hypothetical protein [Noviherbaspirillum humi]
MRADLYWNELQTPPVHGLAVAIANRQRRRKSKPRIDGAWLISFAVHQFLLQACDATDLTRVEDGHFFLASISARQAKNRNCALQWTVRATPSPDK